MPGVPSLGSLLLPPRLLLRAAEDMHTLALAAGTLAGEWRRAGGEAVDLASALDNLDSLSDAAARLPEVERVLAARVDDVETRLTALLALLERLDARLAAIEGLAPAVERLDARAAALERSADRLAVLLEKLPGV